MSHVLRGPGASATPRVDGGTIRSRKPSHVHAGGAEAVARERMRRPRRLLEMLFLVACLALGCAGAWRGAPRNTTGASPRHPAYGGARLRRAAIVLSGGLRTFLHCNESLHRRVALPNPDFALDFYVYAVVDGDDKDAGRALVALEGGGWPALRALASAAAPAFAADVGAALPPPGLAASPPGEGTARGKAGNIASMFRSIELADALRVADVGRTHDVVIRARPDLFWCADVNLTAALALADRRPGAVLVPWAEGDLAFDQVAVSSPKAAAAYASGFSRTLAPAVAARRPLYPEREMARHLARAGLAPYTLRAFRSALVRRDESGAPYHEDAYAKLRSDFPDLATTMPPYLDGCPRRALHHKKKRVVGELV